jgi:hypothetical protein
MKTVKFVNGGYAEIYSRGLEFQLYRSDGEPYNGTTCCKDFFTDAFWAEHHDAKTRIHGFATVPGRLDLKAETYAIAMRREGEKLGIKASLLQGFLNEWDRAYGFPLTKVEPVNDSAGVLVTFSREWTARPVMISLLTGLMRLGLAWNGEAIPEFFARLRKSGNPYGIYDKSEFGKKGVIPLILESLESGKTPHPTQTFMQYKEAHAAHHGGGFIAFTTGEWTG